MARGPQRRQAAPPHPQQRSQTILPIIADTQRGQEAAMYGAIRDLFIECLGYAPDRVLTDVAGVDGRPDVTVRADAGITDANGQPRLVDWIVVEAKAQPGTFTSLTSRERVFSGKAKYITPNTAWFMMIDPSTIVARPVDAPVAANADIVIPITRASDIEGVKTQLQRLHANISGVPASMERFRDGDLTLLAYQKLTPDPRISAARLQVARRRFSAALKGSAQELCDATAGALDVLSPDIERLRIQVAGFKATYRNAVVAAVPPVAHASARSREEQVRMEADARALRLALQRSRHVAKLAVDVIPTFTTENGNVVAGTYRKFAVQSAHLLLARVLLLRFLEDNGFFGQRRYVCNGGVKAFQEIFRYFGTNYSRLLEQAYGEGGKIYAAAFDTSNLDWVISVDTPELSRAIERTLFQLSQFDFQTVKGDVLNGIYERFQDESQRKLLGEFYTPPSIATHMLRKAGVGPETRLFDPACGSGTFLICAYDLVVGEDAARGVADFASARQTLENLSGNDLNGFSAILTQIQLLWHLMPFKDEMLLAGLPPLRITENVNSLRLRRVDDLPSAFDEIDRPVHNVVAGNPPYVRSERSDGGLDRGSSQHYVQSVGKINVAGLFVHRALEHWCSDAEGAMGKLAFVLPVGVFDGDEYEKLRRTFAPGPGNRRKITGLIDLEAIHHQVFPEAKVIPVLFFAEVGESSWDDLIEVSIPGPECVEPSLDGERAIFHLERAPSWRIRLSDILLPNQDFRVLTRLTPGRAKILHRLRPRRTFADVAARFWVRKQGASFVEWQANPPPVGHGLNWIERIAIGGGMTFRGNQPAEVNGNVAAPSLWKGQHIVTGGFVGNPLVRALDITTSDDHGLRRYNSALPLRGWTFPQITLAPCCAPMQRDEYAFDNTVTLFFPREDIEEFPFDLLVASRVYTWLYAVGHRMGLLARSNGRSHLYAANLRNLPVPDDLASLGVTLCAMRTEFETACEAVTRSVAAMGEALSLVPAVSLRQAVRDAGARLSWSDAFDHPTTAVAPSQATLGVVEAHGPTEGALSRIGFGDLLTYIEIDDVDLANRFLAGLAVIQDDLKRPELLNVRVPADPMALVEWQQIVLRFTADTAMANFELTLNRLDAVVAEALGLGKAVLHYIIRDIGRDPILRNIRPRLPGAEPRAQNLIMSLKSRTRYRT